MDEISTVVTNKVNNLCRNSAFIEWHKGQKLSSGDLILINNSFVHRDKSFIKTTKNPQYLSIKVAENDPFSIQEINVARTNDFILDYKYVSQKSKESVELVSLEEAVRDEILHLGKIIFILIGMIDQYTTFEEQVNKTEIDKVILNFNQDALLKVEEKNILINDPSDGDFLWEEFIRQTKATKLGDTSPLEALKTPFQNAVKNLRDNSFLALQLPANKEGISNTFLDVMVEAIRKQIEEYKTSLRNCGENLDQDYKEFNNVLRIAYNFSTDAVKLLKLLISICDLKPMILWMTIDEQIVLVEALKRIPGLSKKKPDLNEYISIVHGARNKAFHDLFPFNYTIEAQLDGVSLSAKRLRFFSPFTARAKNVFEYEDQQLIDILTEFTRAEEKHVDQIFWQRNLDVMNATLNLLDSVSSSLKLLYCVV